MVALSQSEESQVSKVVIRPHDGPQTQFFATKADIAIYGGQAGGGKSWSLVVEPTRWHRTRGFKGIIFRRTSPQLTGQGGVWDEALGIYPLLGARMREGAALDARFKCGASIAFRHLQHEKTKYEYQGHQFAYLGFDELTHFTETQFFYMLSRMRSTCGVRPYCRATCNPDAGSWVAEFIAWWIDQDSGFPIKERSGKLRYFYRDSESKLHWANSKEELLELFPDNEPNDFLSVTFIPATLDDNPTLLQKDPGYKGRLKAQAKVERARLLEGNWKASEGSQIPHEWLHEYRIVNNEFHCQFQKLEFRIPIASSRRFATIDTAGTSKEKAAEKRGDEPSWSVCGIWDWVPTFAIFLGDQRYTITDALFLRHVWRDRVNWDGLKANIPEVLESWNVPKAYIENAHFGQPLSKEIKVCSVELIGPVIAGMDDTSRGAKLERAIASGMLSRFENGKVFLPAIELGCTWLAPYRREITVWTGLPSETADQIDMTSYACYVSKRAISTWGGVIKSKG